MQVLPESHAAPSATSSASEKPPVPPGDRHKKPRRLHTLLKVLAFGIGIGMIYLAWYIVNAPAPTNKYDFDFPGKLIRSEEGRQSVAVFYRDQIDPLVDVYNQRNQEAAARAVATLHDHFVSFHAGVEVFTDDITGWGTRFGILKRMPADLWSKWWHNNDNTAQVQQYVMEKFYTHVLSQTRLQSALVDAITQFQGDLAANRNELMSQVQLVMRTHAVPVHLKVNEHDFERLVQRIDQNVAALISNMGEESVVTMIVSNLGGEVAGVALTQLARSGAAYLAANLARVGGATVVGTAVGASGGTTVGPVGTVIGVAVGLTTGIIIDWWMTDTFREKIAAQINTFLDELESFALHGPKDGTVTTPDASWAGFTHAFAESMKLAEQSMRTALFKTLVEHVS